MDKAWLAKQPQEPILDPEPPIVDTHPSFLGSTGPRTQPRRHDALAGGLRPDDSCDEALPQKLAGYWRPYMEVRKVGTVYAALWNSFTRIAASRLLAEERALFAGIARHVYPLGDG